LNLEAASWRLPSLAQSEHTELHCTCPLLAQSGDSARSESCPKLTSELLGCRTLANEKMVNRVGRHKCGVTLWQMWLLPRVAKRHLDRVEVPPDGLEHNFGRRCVNWLENSIFKAPHLTVDQSRRRGVKSLEQFISASRRSSCPKDPRNWSRGVTDRHNTPPWMLVRCNVRFWIPSCTAHVRYWG
jgi:hypothetical protein